MKNRKISFGYLGLFVCACGRLISLFFIRFKFFFTLSRLLSLSVFIVLFGGFGMCFVNRKYWTNLCVGYFAVDFFSPFFFVFFLLYCFVWQYVYIVEFLCIFLCLWVCKTEWMMLPGINDCSSSLLLSLTIATDSSCSINTWLN